uniref:Uncharacterized protein n=1 Tax=Gadus morhua TaxID=8049 RepID=A0A8C5FEC0_GADMO
MWVWLPLRAWITSPSASRERFIFWASFSLSPSAPDFHTLSDPARSTRFNLPRDKGEPGTCSCPVPSGLILMSNFSPSLLSRSLWTKTTHATTVSCVPTKRKALFTGGCLYLSSSL